MLLDKHLKQLKRNNVFSISVEHRCICFKQWLYPNSVFTIEFNDFVFAKFRTMPPNVNHLTNT